MQLLQTTDTLATLGEGIRWDPMAQAFWWTDILGKRLYRLTFGEQNPDCFVTPKRLASFSLSSSPPSLLCAFDDELALWTPGEDRYESLFQLEQPGQRFNDGRAAKDGAFWVGTMVEDESISHELGSLFRFRAGSEPMPQKQKLRITNSLCWSPLDGSQYFSDSALKTVYRAPANGLPAEPFLELNDAEPDGMTADRDGDLWLACWGASEVRRFSPTGELLERHSIPARQVSCCAFGGPDYRHLAVTSARVGLSDPSPADGATFIYLTDSQGDVDPIAVLD